MFSVPSVEAAVCPADLKWKSVISAASILASSPDKDILGVWNCDWSPGYCGITTCNRLLLLTVNEHTGSSGTWGGTQTESQVRTLIIKNAVTYDFS